MSIGRILRNFYVRRLIALAVVYFAVNFILAFTHMPLIFGRNVVLVVMVAAGIIVASSVVRHMILAVLRPVRRALVRR